MVGSLSMVELMAPNLLEQFSWIINWIKAIGLVFIVYIIYKVFIAVSMSKSRKRIRRIEAKLLELDKKIDKLLKKKQTSKKDTKTL